MTALAIDNSAMLRLIVRLDSAEQLLGLMRDPPASILTDPYPYRVSVIVKAVAFHMGLTAVSIIGRRKTAPLCRARAAVCWLSRQLTDKSLVQIGRVLGDRDHSTVICALARAERLRDRDAAFRMLTDRLVSDFQALKQEN